MSESERFVVMEVVNYVRVTVSVQEQQFVGPGPTMATGNDRMLRRTGSDRSDQFFLNPKPAVTIFNHRFIDDFQEDALRVSLGKMRGQRLPESSERLDEPVILVQL